MKRKIFTIAVVLLSAMSLMAQKRDSLAVWTFDLWGNKIVPDGLAVDLPIPAERGLQAGSVALGTEAMFSADPENPVPGSRKWSIPTRYGYIRTSGSSTEEGWNGAPALERYYLLSGLSTTGIFGMQMSSGFATSGTGEAYYYSFKVQYRIGGENGTWTDWIPAFQITRNSESDFTQGPKNVALPSECENVAQVDIRWLCTVPATTTSTQYRIDDFIITGFRNAATGVPTIYDTFGDIDFGEVTLGSVNDTTVHVIAQQITGNLTVAVDTPFQLDKTTVNRDNAISKKANDKVKITFAPTEEGVFSKTLTISGGGATSKTITVTGIVTGGSNTDNLTRTLDYVYAKNGLLVINSPKAEPVFILDIAGRIIKTQSLNRGVNEIPLTQGQLYIVKIGNDYKKILL